jgi:hypothetical protein
VHSKRGQGAEDDEHVNSPPINNLKLFAHPVEMFTALLLSSSLLAATAASSLLAATAAPPPPPPTRILFIGNSFTFVNDLPHQLINIAKSLGKEVRIQWYYCRSLASEA